MAQVITMEAEHAKPWERWKGDIDTDETNIDAIKNLHLRTPNWTGRIENERILNGDKTKKRLRLTSQIHNELLYVKEIKNFKISSLWPGNVDNHGRNT